MLINRYVDITNYKIVPAICQTCGHKETMRRPDRQTTNALVDASSLSEFQEEYHLLSRTSALFAKYPESRHKLKAEKEHLEPNQELSDTDIAFEAELSSDPELKQFLETTGFRLSARLPFVEESISRLKQKLVENRVRCTECTDGIMAVESEFFSQIG